MNDRLKGAFDQIQADEALKCRTKAFLVKKTGGYAHGRRFSGLRLIPALACCLLVILGGSWLWFTPTIAISIDINPSLELGVNRFDRVVSTRGYNEDGQELAESLDLHYLNYIEAVSRILASEKVSALLAGDEVLSVGVIGSDDARCAKMLSELESCTTEAENTYCYHADEEWAASAHEAGLSCGKYQAFLELQTLDPTITPEEVEDLTMREIREQIQTLSGDDAIRHGQGGRHGAGGRSPQSSSHHAHGNSVR